MEEEGKPVDLRTEPALEPLGPGEADVAERSGVVAPDRDRKVAHEAQASCERKFLGLEIKDTLDTILTSSNGRRECRFA